MADDLAPTLALAVFDGDLSNLLDEATGDLLPAVNGGYFLSS